MKTNIGETIQVAEIVKPVTMPMLLQQTIPIGVGLAIPLSFRNSVLRALPAGWTARLGRFGVAAAESMIGAGEGLVASYFLPPEWKSAGYLAASATFALAGFDALKSLLGGASRTSPVGRVSEARRVSQPRQPPQAPFAQY